MRKTFLVLGVAATAYTAQAQEVKNYEVSVFDNYKLLDITNRQTAATTLQRSAAAFPGFMVATDKISGTAKDIYGKSMAVPGNTVADKAAYVMNNQLKALGVNSADWKMINETSAPHASYVNYEQQVNGRKVAFSRISFRFTPAGDLQRVIIDNYGTPSPKATARLDRNSILSSAAMTSELSNIDITTKTVENNWVWFPVPNNNGYELQAAYPFTVWGTDEIKEMPIGLEGYISAENGEVLYCHNEVKEDVGLVVKGTVYKDGITNPTSDEPLADIEVKIGSTIVNSNANGLANFTSLTTVPQSATTSLKGLWSTVTTTTTPATPTIPYTIAKNPDTLLLDGTTLSKSNQVNAYYHVTRVHDFAKALFPTAVPGIDISLPTRVDIVSPTGCNAFYSGNTINFYAENASCNDFSLIGDIVYHEYGHFINDKFYRQTKGTGMRNGGLNEGVADVWAMLVSKNGVMGEMSFKNGSNIRNYTGAPKVYPINNTSEVHANGEIIAGAWWDAGINIGNLDTLAKIFVKTFYDVPDGPEGTEGDVYHQVLVSALINDDDDGNFANGTPHFKEIVSAFAKHGIYLFGVGTLDHKELAHQSAGQPIPVTASLIITAQQKDAPVFMALKLVYRNRDNATTWDTVTMNNLGAGTSGGIDFNSQIPSQDGGSILDYYFVSYDLYGNPAYSFPVGYNTITTVNQATIPYQFGVGLNPTSIKFDFEDTAATWTIGNVPGDNATSGKWIQAVPIAANWTPSGGSYVSQTGQDHTSGTGKCLVTGNATGDYNLADVDNGKTTALSPMLDLSGIVYPVIEYYRWYSNDRGGRDTNPRNDLFQVQVKDQNSTIWKPVDASFQSDQAWRRRIFALKDYWPSSTSIQIRFIAADDIYSNVSNNGQGNVEAAVDDIFVYDIFPTSVGNKPAPVKMSVYPNPANNTLNISLGQGTAGKLSIADLTGRIISTQDMDAATTTYTFNTGTLIAGTYMLMIKTSNTVQTHKVTVAH